MKTLGDPVLLEMAGELRRALLDAGLDPKNPPGGIPPSTRLFQEYQRRGGTVYVDQDECARALVAEVGRSRK